MSLSSVAWFWFLFWKQIYQFIIFGKIMAYPFRFSGQKMKEKVCLRGENVDDEHEISLLDLPELAMDLILERLEPKTLCSMTVVCSYMREKCARDHLWERHTKQKWGRLVGDAAKREWQCHVACTWKPSHFRNRKRKSLLRYASSLWPCRDKLGNVFSPLSEDSIMAWYHSLETGNFWFPAQVYNRENGKIGFVLSCYDAEVGYDSRTDSFKARYSPQGRSTVEYNVEWDRVRPPAVDTPSRYLHASSCLDDLAPGDHIEIQWRRNKDFSYGWWYGVVGHVEYCDGDKMYCQCHDNETVILEFKQYTPGSRWRLAEMNRKEHREIGNESDGFYGGIRKLYHEDEISVWKRLWPTHALE